MIVPMQRLTLLCVKKDADRVLDVVRELGTVHITSVQPPAGEDLDAYRQRLDRALKAQEIIAHEGAAEGQEKELGAPGGLEPDHVIDQVHELVRRRQDVEQLLDAYRFELERLGGFGDFDPATIAAVAEKGIAVKLIQASPATALSAPQGWELRRLGTGAHGEALYALIGMSEADAAPPDLGGAFTEVRPPQRSTAELRVLAEEAEKEIESARSEIAGLVAYEAVLTQRVADLRERVEFLEVREGMGGAEQVAYLQGYIPKETVGRLRERAQEMGFAVVAETPRAGEDVPTLISYPKILKPIKTLFDILRILPSYWETDVSWTFMVFFTIFVGMLIGDAGYGLLLLAVTGFLAVRSKKASRSALVLLLLLGLSVTAFGIMSGSWLGIKPLPPALESLRIPWLGDNDNIMSLCFLIGAIHITIAHIWNIIEVFPKPQFLAQLGWTAVVWAMYFLANSVVLGRGLPTFMMYLLGAGVLLVVLFMTPFSQIKKNVINHALLPLTLVNFFVDIISYVRLFAVGVATVAVMESFNGMAASVGFGNVLTAVFAVLILIFGHTLNLVLAGLAVLVHGVRLNTLEFSSHKGLSWSGNPFRPFARRS